MTSISPEIDPSEVGLDPRRLERIGGHFDQYVQDRRIPGFLAVVTRGGKVAYVDRRGYRDLESGAPVEGDTRFRIYSMTKLITSVAVMICYEEGLLDLDDPLSKFVPEFEHTRVFAAGSSVSPVTVPVERPITIWNLLTHTAGLTYGWKFKHPVDAMYRSAGFHPVTPEGLDLAGCCRKLAKLPLCCQPGTEWNYSVATDVLGRVVEVVSGQSLDQFFEDRVFKPLVMRETSFYVEGEGAEKLAVLYSPEAVTGRATRATREGKLALSRPSVLLGGSGLVSTAADYHRLTQMMLNKGTLDGVRILGPRTVSYMARNHLPGGVDMAHFGGPIPEASDRGVGFGLGVSVVIDPVALKLTCNAGQYGWSGSASTWFWVDPVEELTVLFFTQLIPSSTYPIRRELEQLVYSAIVE